MSLAKKMLIKTMLFNRQRIFLANLLHKREIFRLMNEPFMQQQSNFEEKVIIAKCTLKQHYSATANSTGGHLSASAAKLQIFLATMNKS